MQQQNIQILYTYFKFLLKTVLTYNTRVQAISHVDYRTYHSYFSSSALHVPFTPWLDEGSLVIDDLEVASLFSPSQIRCAYARRW